MTSLEVYHALFQVRFALVASIVFSCFGVIVNSFLLYGIVWYERFGSDNKRTLMNKLESTL
jgi:hypothetical protein